MPVTPIEFPTSSFPNSRRPSESLGRLLNIFSEPEGEQTVWKRIPGTKRFANVGKTTPRGMIEVDKFIYAAYEDCIVKIGPDRSVTELTGALPGTDRVSWGKNNQAPKQFCCVTSIGSYQVTPLAVTPLADPDLPGTPTSACYMDGYIFFTYNNGRIFATDLNALTVDALSYTTAESNPDGVLRGIVSGRQLFACGQASIEVYQNVGSTPFPLSRAAVIPVGIAGTWAIAGGNETDGWDSSPLFVAADGTVRQLQGYEPKIVSTRTVERFLEDLPDRKSIDTYVYTFLGHSIFGIRGAGTNAADRCWEFNTSTGQWHERRSMGSWTWRGFKTVRAWDRWICGDTMSTELREIDWEAQKECDTLLPCRLESKNMKGFPARIAVPRADFSFSQGIGTALGLEPIEADPRCEISWSDDGGGHWSTPLQRTLGRQGEYDWDVRVNRTGMTSKVGRRWRLDIADPVAFCFFGGTMEVEQRES